MVDKLLRRIYTDLNYTNGYLAVLLNDSKRNAQSAHPAIP